MRQALAARGAARRSQGHAARRAEHAAFAKPPAARGIGFNPGFAGSYDFSANADYAALFPELPARHSGARRHHVPSRFCRRDTQASGSAHKFARARTCLFRGRHVPANFGTNTASRCRDTPRADPIGLPTSCASAEPQGGTSMTPQERKLVDELFERLATLERRPREPDAEQAIMAGLRKAPNATYALVQTVLLQEEALRQADERIRELEGGDADAPQQDRAAFSIRCATRCSASRPRSFGAAGRRQRSPDGRAARLSHRQRLSAERRQAMPPEPPQPPQAAAGGSFLGTAAAAAVGVIGGTMLMNSHARHARQRPCRASGFDRCGSRPAGSSASANPWGGDATRRPAISPSRPGSTIWASPARGSRGDRDRPATISPHDPRSRTTSRDGGFEGRRRLRSRRFRFRLTPGAPT